MAARCDDQNQDASGGRRSIHLNYHPNTQRQSCGWEAGFTSVHLLSYAEQCELSNNIYTCFLSQIETLQEN